ncbi:MAG: hypothetical protein QG612_2776 [Pseudomonadota bacterium]|nr:hypothetical protein [Pseudomonadota bacterium]
MLLHFHKSLRAGIVIFLAESSLKFKVDLPTRCGVASLAAMPILADGGRSDGVKVPFGEFQARRAIQGFFP